jgi:hypothetical protein
MKQLVLVSALLIYFFNQAQISITRPSFKFTACSLPSQYMDLGVIKLTETTNGDFAIGDVQTIQISVPTNFQFEPNVGNVVASNGGNVRNTTITVTNSLLTITYDCTGNNKSDEITISGVKIRAIAYSNGIFSRTGGNASINGFSNGTSVSNTITAIENIAGRYRTVINTSSNLNWNSSTTWECGIIPPNDGTAEINISAYNGGYSVLNSVVFGNAIVKSITIESGANFSPPGNSGTTFVVNENFNIETGAFFRQYNWASSGKNAIEIKGNYTNNGEMTTTGSNNTYDLDITFNGSSPQTISGSGIFRMISNGSQTSTLTFNNSKGIILNANFSTEGLFGDAGAVIINGLLSFGSSSNQFTGAGTIAVNGHVVLKASTFNGHFANTGAKTLGATAKVEYTNLNSSISSTNIPSLNLYQLVSNTGTNGLFTVSGNLLVSNQLSLNSGNINLGSNILTIGTSLTNLGSISHTSGFIIGKVKRWFNSTNLGNESGLFPLGISGKRKFIKVEYTQATDGGTITAEWIPSSMGYNFTNDPIVTSCNGSFEIYNTASGYWSMTPGDGITNAESKKYNITLFADGLLDFTDDCHVTALKRQGTNPWMQSGTHVDNSGDAISPNVQRIGASGWSNWGFAGGSGTPLPVELSNFSLTCDENGSTIYWTTQSEYNSKTFELEESRDGFSWDNTATISAAGISNEEIEYQYYVERSSQIKYFRIRQIDINGDEKIYGPIINNCSKSFELTSFPNPSEKEFNILINSNKSDETSILTIYDINGRILIETSIQIQTGLNLFHIDNTTDFKKGTYFIKISGQNIETSVLKHLIK